MFRYNNSTTWSPTTPNATYGRLEEYALGRTTSGANVAAWLPLLTSNDGPIDISAPPYGAPCNGNSDISASVQSAVNTGRTVYIPPTTNGCVFGGITMNGHSNLIGEHSIVKPAAGYPYVIKITSDASVRGLYVNETTSVGQLSNVVTVTTLAAAAPAGATGISVSSLTGLTNIPPLTITFTNGSAVIGSSSNNLFAGEQVQLATTGSLPTGFSPGTSYYVIATGLTTTAFELSTSSNGPAIVAGSAGSGTATAITQSVPLQIGQRLNVLLANGSNFFDFITGVSGTTVSFTKPLPSAANSGARVWATFGDIYVTCGAQNFGVRDINIGGVWGGVMLDCNAANQNILTGVVSNLIEQQGRMFGLVIGRGTAANLVDFVNYTGGWMNAWTANGDGSTTSFTSGERVFSGTNAASSLVVKVGGTTCIYGTGGTCPYTVSVDGTAILFNSAPAAGTGNISVSERIFSAEGVTIDGTGSVIPNATAGNMINHLQSGQADIPCLALNGNTTNNTFTNAFCAPGATYAASFDGVTGMTVSGLTALNAPVSLNIANGASVQGDITLVPVVGTTTLADGYVGLPYTIDPASKFIGTIQTQGIGRRLYFASGSSPAFYTGTPLTASQSGTCTLSSAVVGQLVLPCSGGTTGTLAAGEVGTSTAYMLASTAIRGVTGTTITLSPPGLTAAISGSTTLSFAGPMQSSGVSCSGTPSSSFASAGGVVTHC